MRNNKKIGILVYTDYLLNLKNAPANEVTEVALKFDKIEYFTTDFTGQNLKQKPNYICVIDIKNNVYYIPGHLKNLINLLPEHFVRINDGYIINILSPSFEGRINGKTVKIMNKKLQITKTFIHSFNERILQYYIEGKIRK